MVTLEGRYHLPDIRDLDTLTPDQAEALAAVTQPADDHHPEDQMRQLER